MNSLGKLYQVFIFFIVFNIAVGQIPVPGLILCIEEDGSFNVELLSGSKKCADKSYIAPDCLIFLRGLHDTPMNGDGCTNCLDIPINSGTIDDFVPRIAKYLPAMLPKESISRDRCIAPNFAEATIFSERTSLSPHSHTIAIIRTSILII